MLKKRIGFVSLSLLILLLTACAHQATMKDDGMSMDSRMKKTDMMEEKGMMEKQDSMKK